MTTADPPPGTFADRVVVTLSCADPGGAGCAHTFVTADGSDPGADQTRYTGPLELTESTTLRLFSNDLQGNREAVQSLQYTVDADPPHVVSHAPAGGSADPRTVASVVFSEAIDPATLDHTSLIMDGVTGAVTYDASTFTATFTPAHPLSFGTTYDVLVTTAVTDRFGHPLAEAYHFAFTTTEPPPPESFYLDGGLSAVSNLAVEVGAGGTAVASWLRTLDRQVQLEAALFNPATGAWEPTVVAYTWAYGSMMEAGPWVVVAAVNTHGAMILWAEYMCGLEYYGSIGGRCRMATATAHLPLVGEPQVTHHDQWHGDAMGGFECTASLAWYPPAVAAAGDDFVIVWNREGKLSPDVVEDTFARVFSGSAWGAAHRLPEAFLRPPAVVVESDASFSVLGYDDSGVPLMYRQTYRAGTWEPQYTLRSVPAEATQCRGGVVPVVFAHEGLAPLVLYGAAPAWGSGLALWQGGTLADLPAPGGGLATDVLALAAAGTWNLVWSSTEWDPANRVWVRELRAAALDGTAWREATVASGAACGSASCYPWVASGSSTGLSVGWLRESNPSSLSLGLSHLQGTQWSAMTNLQWYRNPALTLDATRLPVLDVQRGGDLVGVRISTPLLGGQSNEMARLVSAAAPGEATLSRVTGMAATAAGVLVATRSADATDYRVSEWTSVAVTPSPAWQVNVPGPAWASSLPPALALAGGGGGFAGIAASDVPLVRLAPAVVETRANAAPLGATAMGGAVVGRDGSLLVTLQAGPTQIAGVMDAAGWHVLGRFDAAGRLAAAPLGQGFCLGYTAPNGAGQVWPVQAGQLGTVRHFASTSHFQALAEGCALSQVDGFGANGLEARIDLLGEGGWQALPWLSSARAVDAGPEAWVFNASGTVFVHVMVGHHYRPAFFRLAPTGWQEESLSGAAYYVGPVDSPHAHVVVGHDGQGRLTDLVVFKDGVMTRSESALAVEPTDPLNTFWGEAVVPGPHGTLVIRMGTQVPAPPGPYEAVLELRVLRDGQTPVFTRIPEGTTSDVTAVAAAWGFALGVRTFPATGLLGVAYRPTSGWTEPVPLLAEGRSRGEGRMELVADDRGAALKFSTLNPALSPADPLWFSVSVARYVDNWVVTHDVAPVLWDDWHQDRASFGLVAGGAQTALHVIEDVGGVRTLGVRLLTDTGLGPVERIPHPPNQPGVASARFSAVGGQITGVWLQPSPDDPARNRLWRQAF
ncbi:MAG: Ig-like domain-containing protein [Deltaproteobacteria bacterium]|nr:Ig-like domain-containing protein [Deltaproteobacteria bacterium]